MKSVNFELSFLFKHSSIYGLGNILSKLVAFILLPLYTNYLTPTDYGILELVSITSGMLGVVIGLGITQAMTRFYYDFDDKDNRNLVVSTIYIIVFLISGCSLLLFPKISYWAAVLVFDSPEYAVFFFISFCSLILGIVLDLGQVYLRILYKSTIYVSISIATLILGVSLNILFIAIMQYGVIGALYGNLISKIIIVIPVTVIILYTIGIKFSQNLAYKMIKYSMPLIPSSIANSAVNYSDRYFINYFVSTADAGIYSIANKIGTAIHLLITSPFIMTFLPRRFQIVNESNAKNIFKQVYLYYCLIIVFLGLSIAIMSNEIIQLMTTPDFYKAGPLIPIIILSMIIFGMKYHFDFGIHYSKKTKYFAYINTTSAISHIGLNLILVKNFGLWGALYASLFAYTLNTVLIYIAGNSLYKIGYDFLKTSKIFLIALILFILSRAIQFDNMALTLLWKFSLITFFPFWLIKAQIIPTGQYVAAKEYLSRFYYKLRQITI